MWLVGGVCATCIDNVNVGCSNPDRVNQKGIYVDLYNLDSFFPLSQHKYFNIQQWRISRRVVRCVEQPITRYYNTNEDSE